jgi:hypothetical protein
LCQLFFIYFFIFKGKAGGEAKPALVVNISSSLGKWYRYRYRHRPVVPQTSVADPKT